MHDDHHHEYEHTSEPGTDGRGAAPLTAGTERMLLLYMLEHNREHTAEIRTLAGKLRAAGNTEAAERLETGAAQYDAGDAFLAEALEILE